MARPNLASVMTRSVAFAAGFAMMTVELAAGRLSAPWIGVSLYTWTSVIAAVMAGIALGAWLGGRIADRATRVRLEAWAFFAAALAVALAPFAAAGAGRLLSATALPLPMLTASFALLVFFPQAVVLGSLAPVLVRRRLRRLEETGSVAGELGAWNAAGSLVGTYLTGYVFIGYIGTHAIFWSVAGLLAIAAVVLLFFRQRVILNEVKTLTPSEVLRSAQDDRRRFLFPALACAAGFALMLVQIVSGRALAPYIGTSIFTWTNVIAATLIGIITGNYVGGLVADRRMGRIGLGASWCAAGIACLIANYTLPLADRFLAASDMHLALRSLLYTFIVFFPPATALAALGPQHLKLDLLRIDVAGRETGRLGAWNAIGSILGTLSGGFVLISAMGTKRLLAVLAFGLILLGIFLAREARFWRHRLGVVVVLLFIGDLITPGLCQMETNYFCIRVKTDGQETDRTYTLRLDHLVHSYVTPEQPARLGYGYEHVYANLIAMKRQPADAFSAYFIGGGGYVLPRYLERFYPKAEATVAEIDAGVTQANRLFMELPATTTVKTVNEDARIHLARLGPDVRYDFVFADAFNDFSVPYHLTTVEFHRLLKSHMKADGVYALNIIDDVRHGDFLASMIRTLAAVWRYVEVAPQAGTLIEGRNTVVLMASDEPIDRDRWQAARPLSDFGSDFVLAGDRAAVLGLLDPAEIEDFLSRKPAPALTDDFVPVDRYLAPVFSDAY